MQELPPAAKAAGEKNTGLSAVKVKSIRQAGHADVYNMEVKDHHNFSVNGGLVVHNCPDAARYAIYNLEENHDVWEVWEELEKEYLIA